VHAEKQRVEKLLEDARIKPPPALTSPGGRQDRGTDRPFALAVDRLDEITGVGVSPPW